VRGGVGLQSRATPVVSYVRGLIKEGYVGEVLSTSLVGSGILWGAILPATYIYTLDPKNGAGMINVAFAHGLDSASYALGSPIKEVTATNELVPMATPDQIIVGGTLENETFLSVHYRGGLSRGTNFRWENQWNRRRSHRYEFIGLSSGR